MIDVLTRWEEFFSNVYAQKVTTIYTLNILQFYLSIISQ